MREALFVAGFGAAGALARWLLSAAVHRWLGSGFAWGTLIVNLLGCFALGLLMQLALSGTAVPRELRLGLGVGFLGAFTTFSTFSYETLGYLQEGSWKLALSNVVVSLICGLAAVWLGIVAGRSFTGGV